MPHTPNLHVLCVHNVQPLQPFYSPNGERTLAGQAKAWKEDKTKGRPKKTIDNDRKLIVELLKKGASASQISRDYKISRASVIGIRDYPKLDN